MPINEAADKARRPKNPALTAACSYAHAGISVIPIRRDGSKAPDGISWKQYQKRRASEREIATWFDRPEPPGPAIVGGRVSGNLEQLDFDREAPAVFPAWCELVEAEAPGLVERLSVSTTPKPGFHVRYRCPETVIPGNLKLATDPGAPPGEQVLIETRGEGGYALAPGCPPECHATGRTYEHYSGPKLSQVQEISATEREILIRCARSFDRPAPGDDGHTANCAGADGFSPGDDFCQRGPEWSELLSGWTFVREADGKKFWRRPGKDGRGWSATTGCKSKAGRELLYVFSSEAAPFEAGKTYNKFAVYALLNHGGDFHAATRELAAKGYGVKVKGGHNKVAGAPPDSSDSPDEPWEAPVPLGGIPQALEWSGDVLPPPVEQYIRDVALAKGCPPDYVALPVLVLAGAAIGTARALEVKPGWRERACIYGAVIGPPGSAKTPALKAVALPVYQEQSRRLAQYKRDKQAWEERDGDKALAPKLETVYVCDVTTEKLACVLQDNGRGVALIRDELTGWVAGMDQYRSKGRGADRQVYLSVWAGEPIRVDRKNQGEPVYVAHPFLGVIGGLPPALLPQLRGERGLWDGFLDRVLTTYPEPVPARGEDWACVSDEAADSWKRVLAYLWGLQPALSDYGEQPRVVYLSVCGRRAWEGFTARLAAELNRDDLPDPVKGHLAKAKGYGARLALIIHCLRLACGEDVAENVDGESVERAGRLTDYFYSHCKKVHVALGLDQEVEDARRVLEWVRREKAREFKRYQVFEDVKSKIRFPRIEDLDRPIDRLLKHHYLRLKPAVKKPGRPPDPVFEVNPAVYDGPKNPVNPTNSKKAGKTGGLSDFVGSGDHPTKPEKLKGNGGLQDSLDSSDGLPEQDGEEEAVGPWGDPL
jgi:hypothetical protein